MSFEKKQEELFELYFEEKEDTINMKELIESMNDVYLVWQDLYNILNKGLEYFNNYSKVMQMKVIEQNNTKYLFTKMCTWDYLIIDLNNKKVIENIGSLFDLNLFTSYFNEEEKYDIERYYNFETCSKETVNKIIDLFNDKQEILTKKNSISYEIKSGISLTYINIDLSRLNTTLAFVDFENGTRCNYIFIDKDLNPSGASNPTNNKESLMKIGERVKDINIPKSVIDDYDMNKEKKKIIKYELI